jgi:hypothetical protein
MMPPHALFKKNKKKNQKWLRVLGAPAGAAAPTRPSLARAHEVSGANGNQRHAATTVAALRPSAAPLLPPPVLSLSPSPPRRRRRPAAYETVAKAAIKRIAKAFLSRPLQSINIIVLPRLGDARRRSVRFLVLHPLGPLRVGLVVDILW